MDTPQQPKAPDALAQAISQIDVAARETAQICTLGLGAHKIEALTDAERRHLATSLEKQIEAQLAALREIAPTP